MWWGCSSAFCWKPTFYSSVVWHLTWSMSVCGGSRHVAYEERSATIHTHKYVDLYHYFCGKVISRISAAEEIARIGGPYAIQGRSRSLMSVPIESPYATWILVTYIIYRTVYELRLSSGQIIALDKGCLWLMHSLSVTSTNIVISQNQILWTTFCRKNLGLSSTILTQLSPKLPNSVE